MGQDGILPRGCKPRLRNPHSLESHLFYEANCLRARTHHNIADQLVGARVHLRNEIGVVIHHEHVPARVTHVQKSRPVTHSHRGNHPVGGSIDHIETAGGIGSPRDVCASAVGSDREVLD